jgi:hypothetical protein
MTGAPGSNNPLAAFRHAHGMSRRGLADAAGVDTKIVRYAELGTVPPHPALLQAVEANGHDVDDFLAAWWLWIADRAVQKALEIRAAQAAARRSRMALSLAPAALGLADAFARRPGEPS